MLLDVHAHLYPDVYVEAMRASPALRHEGSGDRERHYGPGGLVLSLPVPAPTMEQRLAAMDEAGIDRQLLSVAGPGVMFAAEGGPALARQMNDELLAAAEARRDRFGVLLTLPLHDVDACLQELDRVGGAPGVEGVCVLTTSGSDRLTDARLDPLWATLDDLRHVVLVHPTIAATEYDGCHPDLALYAGFPHETIKAMADLLVGDYPARHPGISWILCHLGGGMAALWDRVATGLASAGAGGSREELLERVRSSFFFDSVCTHAPALSCFVDTFGASPMVFGSDYPHVPPQAVRRTVDGYREAPVVLAAMEANGAALLAGASAPPAP